MDEITREQIGKAVMHFAETHGKKPVAQEELTLYCERMNIKPVLAASEFIDHRYQLVHDSRVATALPLILEALKKLAYIPEFGTAKQRKEMKEANDMVRIAVVQILEQAAITHLMVDSTGRELGEIIGGTVAMAGQTAKNKGESVLLLLAKEKWGGDYTTKHSADYIEEHFGAKKAAELDRNK